MFEVGITLRMDSSSLANDRQTDVTLGERDHVLAIDRSHSRGRSTVEQPAQPEDARRAATARVRRSVASCPLGGWPLATPAAQGGGHAYMRTIAGETSLPFRAPLRGDGEPRHDDGVRGHRAAEPEMIGLGYFPDELGLPSSFVQPARGTGVDGP